MSCPRLNVLVDVSRAPVPTNPPVNNWECWLTQAVIYDGYKTVVVVLDQYTCKDNTA